VRSGEGSIPKAVPLLAVRVGDRVIGSVPGEMTVGLGERVKEAMAASAGPGVTPVLSGLANEFLQYFVTPEEYDRQHYEGGSQLYGRLAGNLIKVSLADLTRRLSTGEPAPAPYDADPRNGVSADAPAFAPGADSARETLIPDPTIRHLDRARFGWQGGARGLDRPLERAFVTVEREVRGRWTRFTDDLGLQVLWRIDEGGVHTAEWEVPLDAPRGRYRFRVTANRYELASRAFDVAATNELRPVVEGGRLRLLYPQPQADRDLTWRPEAARRLVVTFRAGERRIRRTGFGSVPVPAGATQVRHGEAHDPYGNKIATDLALP
jgi:neutral ceramidase